MISTTPLVLLPGMLCDAAIWAPQVRALSGDADCTVLPVPCAATLADMAQAVLAAAPPRFALAGHSMGGRVALEVCRAAPQRVERLCLMSAGCGPLPAGPMGEAETAGRLRLLDIARRDGIAAVAEAWMPELVAPDRLNDPALSAQIRAMIGRQNAATLQAQIAAGAARPDAAPVLAKVSGEVLILCGREDRLQPAEAQAGMARLPRSGRLVLLDGCGHMPTLEQPEVVAEALRVWLAA